jgi:hypothetical protein
MLNPTLHAFLRVNSLLKYFPCLKIYDFALKPSQHPTSEPHKLITKLLSGNPRSYGE